MADFVGSYYASNESGGTHSRQYDPLYAETPVSIVDMERLEVESRAHGRLRQVDALTPTCMARRAEGDEGKSCSAGMNDDDGKNSVTECNDDDLDVLGTGHGDEDDDDMEIPVASMNFQDGTVPSLATVPLSTLVPLPACTTKEDPGQGCQSDSATHSPTTDSSGAGREGMPYGDWGWRDKAKEASAILGTGGAHNRSDSSSVPTLLKSPPVSPNGANTHQGTPSHSQETRQGRFTTVMNLKRSIVRFFSKRER